MKKLAMTLSALTFCATSCVSAGLVNWTQRQYDKAKAKAYQTAEEFEQSKFGQKAKELYEDGYAKAKQAKQDLVDKAKSRLSIAKQITAANAAKARTNSPVQKSFYDHQIKHLTKKLEETR